MSLVKLHLVAMQACLQTTQFLELVRQPNVLEAWWGIWSWRMGAKILREGVKRGNLRKPSVDVESSTK